MTKKTTYMIAHGASVAVVREGVRKPINPGQGFDFHDDEIEAINRAVPGALRKPVNEGTGKKAVEDNVSYGDGDDGADVKTEKPAASAKAKGKSKAAKPKPAAKPEADDADDDDDI